MDNDFTEFRQLKRNGRNAQQACAEAAMMRKDFFFQVRMLMDVYGLDMGIARDIAAQTKVK